MKPINYLLFALQRWTFDAIWRYIVYILAQHFSRLTWRKKRMIVIVLFTIISSFPKYLLRFVSSVRLSYSSRIDGLFEEGTIDRETLICWWGFSRHHPVHTHTHAQPPPRKFISRGNWINRGRINLWSATPSKLYNAQQLDLSGR